MAGRNKKETKTDVVSEAGLNAIEQALSLESLLIDSPTEQPKIEQNDEDLLMASDLSKDTSTTKASAHVPNEELLKHTAKIAPANDDREAVGFILQNLQATPSKTPYVIAAITSLVWVGLSVFGLLPAITSEALSLNLLLSPLGATLVFAAIAPIALFFITAAMAYRSESIRLSSRAFTVAAMRMSEPNAQPAQGITSLGQSVRREVAAMGDGIERALSRATELEALVHKEISALERTYRDNDLKIRSLIDELVSQREAIVQHGDRVRDNILTANDSLNKTLTEGSQKLVGDLNVLGEQIAGSLGNKGEQIASALWDAGEKMLDSFSSRGDLLTENLTKTGEILIDTLSARSQDVDTQLAQATDKLAISLESRSESIAQLITQRGEATENALIKTGTEVREQLVKSSEQLLAAFSDTTNLVTNAIRSEATTMADNLKTSGDEIISGIVRKSSEVESTVESVGQHVADLLANSINGLDAKFLAAGDQLVGAMTAAGTSASFAVSGVGEQIASDIRKEISSLEQTLLGTGENLSRTVSMHLEDAESRLSQATQKLDETLVTRTQEMQISILDQARALDLELQNAAQTVRGSFTETGSMVANTLAEAAQEVIITLGQKGNRLKETISETSLIVDQNLESKVQEIRHALELHTSRMEEAVYIRGENLVTTLAERSSSLEKTVDEKLSKVIDVLSTDGEKLITRISDESSALTGAIDRATIAMSQTMDDRVNRIAGRIAEEGAGVVARVAQETMATETRITVVLSQLENLLQNEGPKLADNVSASARELDAALKAKLEILKAVLGVQGEALIEKISTQIEDIDQTLLTRLQDVKGVLSSHGTKISDEFASEILRLEETLQRQISTFESANENRELQFAKKFDQFAEFINDSIDTRTKVLNETLVVSGADLIKSINDNSKDLVENLEEQIVQVKQTFGAIDQTLASSGEVLVETLKSQIDSVKNTFEQIDSGLEERTKTLNDTLANSGEVLVETLKGQIDSVKTTFEQIDIGLEDRTKVLNETLATRGVEILKTFQEGTSVLQNQGQEMVDAFGEKVTELTQTSERVEQDLSEMTYRMQTTLESGKNILDQASSLLGSLESGVGSRLAEIEATLASSSERSENIAKQTTHQIEMLRGVSSTILSDITGSVEKLEEEVQRLAVAAKLVEETRTRLDGQVAGRQQALEQITKSISDKTEDMENILKSFTGIVEDQLTSAETRARSIGTLLSESAEESTKAIADQFELIRNQTGKERERTASALRQAYEQAVADLGNILGNVTERFHDTTRDLRGITGEIQRDLEVTRDELRRTIIELPQDAGEAANAMRRVVQDQIKALNELGRMINREPRAYDISEKTSVSRPVETRSFESRSFEPKSFEKEDDLEYTPARNKISSEPIYSRKPIFENDYVEPLETFEVQESAHSVKIDNNAQKPDRGWLADLLTRAGREEAPAPRPTATPTKKAPLSNIVASTAQDKSASTSSAMDLLNALEKKASRLVEPNQHIDMWERYLGGDRNAFTTRLYTAEGQRVVEDVRRRYRRDASFRKVVDSYVDELEPLMSEAAQDERKGALAKTFLGLDQGKMFTLLAHASDRLV